MKLSEMEYRRPNLDETLTQLTALCAELKQAHSDRAALAAFNKAQRVSRNIATMATLAEIRHTIDTRDAFYEEENAFFDDNAPKLHDKELDIYRAVLASPYRAQLGEALGALALEKMEVDVKASSPEILPLMAEENALTTAYEKLYASAQIPFDGKKLTVSEMGLYKQSTDRAVRRTAYEAEGAWWDENRAELDDLFDKLIKNRTAQAKLLGYDSFVELGAIRMRRVGYSLADMAEYRAQIKAEVVPVVAKLKAQQHARTGITDPKLYDDAFSFANGNAKPCGTPDEILAAGREMYKRLSADTAEFIDEMFRNELFDVLSKPGKAPGGYCTYLPDYKLPFIFSNFNTTSDDVDVLTHEAGHAFAAYIAAKQDLPAVLEEPGMESCEIHSMSMEFLTRDYHTLFFGVDTGKYELTHTEEAIFFLPYGTMVDEFQHIVYANPTLSPEERNAVWAKLEKEYRPWIDASGLPFYGRGAGWQRQLHIYEYPFYYIDYCLAQTVALQFFMASEQDREDAWKRYMALVTAAGTKTYPQLVELAGFDNPFVPGTMKKLAENVSAWITQHDEQH